MKKYLFSIGIAFAAPALWAFSLANLTQTLQKPANVQGAFTQQRYLKSLSKPMTTQGKFVLIPKKGLLWQMEKPFATTLRVRADGIMQWTGSAWANPNAEQQWTLQLTPKTAITRQIFTRIGISGDTVVRKIQLDEKQGDRTVMQFEQIQTGKPLGEFAKSAL